MGGFVVDLFCRNRFLRSVMKSVRMGFEGKARLEDLQLHGSREVPFIFMSCCISGHVPSPSLFA